MARVNRYEERRIKSAATITATANGDTITGFGSCSQLIARLKVGNVTGGADTYDCKIQTKLGDDWVDLLTFTQATAATSETKMCIRTASVGWSDQLRVVDTIGAGATAATVDLTLIGAPA